MCRLRIGNPEWAPSAKTKFFAVNDQAVILNVSHETGGILNDGQWHWLVARRRAETAELTLMVDDIHATCSATQTSSGPRFSCAGSATNFGALDDAPDELKIGPSLLLRRPPPPVFSTTNAHPLSLQFVMSPRPCVMQVDCSLAASALLDLRGAR